MRESGRIPGSFAISWEQRKLIDLVDVLDGDRGKNYPTSDDFDISGHTLFLNAINVTNDGFLFQDNQFITEEKSNSMGNGKLEEDDIVVTSRGSLGHIAWYNADISSFMPYVRINSGMLILRNKKELETEYLYHFMKSDKGQSQISFISFGSAQPQLTKKGVENLEVVLPTRRDEQAQLGHYFSSIDHLITLHQRNLCILYILERLLYENIKQFEVTVSWEQRELEEIVERVTRKNQDLVSELPLTISAQYGLIDQNEFFDKRVASKDVSGYYLIYNGEFAYNKSTSSDAPWGAIKRLDRYEKGVLSTLYIVFKIRDESVTSSDFLVTYYDTNNWHKDVQAIAAEGARNHGLLNIAPVDFLKTELMLPQDIEEQRKIGDYFKSLNALITLHQRKP